MAEKAENFKLTDQIFQKGLGKVGAIRDRDGPEAQAAQRKEKELLQKRYQQFQRRLARHFLNRLAPSRHPEPQP